MGILQVLRFDPQQRHCVVSFWVRRFVLWFNTGNVLEWMKKVDWGIKLQQKQTSHQDLDKWFTAQENKFILKWRTNVNV